MLKILIRTCMVVGRSNVVVKAWGPPAAAGYISDHRLPSCVATHHRQNLQPHMWIRASRSWLSTRSRGPRITTILLNLRMNIYNVRARLIIRPIADFIVYHLSQSHSSYLFIINAEFHLLMQNFTKKFGSFSKRAKSLPSVSSPSSSLFT
jgi:hypothetical protein